MYCVVILWTSLQHKLRGRTGGVAVNGNAGINIPATTCMQPQGECRRGSPQSHEPTIAGVAMDDTCGDQPDHPVAVARQGKATQVTS